MMAFPGIFMSVKPKPSKITKRNGSWRVFDRFFFIVRVVYRNISLSAMQGKIDFFS
jgi:hypothetical protein